MIPLLDVGFPQGKIPLAHWRLLAAQGIQGVYIRCGDGNDAPDTSFLSLAAGAEMAGLKVGAYHVGFPLPASPFHAGREPELQALRHFRAASSVDQPLPPALDLEWPEPADWPKWGVSAASVRLWTLDYLRELAHLTTRTPVIYLYPDFDAHLFAGASAEELAAFARYPLWLARYGVAAPGTVTPWTAPTLWQRSDGGLRLPSGAPADEDAFLGDDAAWATFSSGIG